MLGKLIGRLSYRGWRDGTRADRRWARGREERQWRREAADDIGPCPHGYERYDHHWYGCMGVEPF